MSFKDYLIYEETLGASGNFDFDIPDGHLYDTLKVLYRVASTVGSGNWDTGLYCYLNGNTTATDYFNTYKYVEHYIGSPGVGEQLNNPNVSYLTARALANAWTHGMIDFMYKIRSSGRTLREHPYNMIEYQAQSASFLPTVPWHGHDFFFCQYRLADGDTPWVNHITLQPDGYPSQVFPAGSTVQVIGRASDWVWPTDIPAREANELRVLFEETSAMSGWSNATGWGTSSTAAGYYGITVAGGKVTKIELPNNNLKGTMYINLNEFTALEVFNVSGNTELEFNNTVASETALPWAKSVGGNQLLGYNMQSTLQEFNIRGTASFMRLSSLVVPASLKKFVAGESATAGTPDLTNAVAIEEIDMRDLKMTRSRSTQLLSDLYGRWGNLTFATPVVKLTGNPSPSGIYQDAVTPTTGKEFIYKMENDPDLTGYNPITFIYDAEPEELREIIYETTLVSDGEFQISSIPATCTHLYIEFAWKSSEAVVNDMAYLFFNNDTTQTNYHSKVRKGEDGTSIRTISNSAQIGVAGNNANANTWHYGTIYIPFYRSSDYKHAQMFNSGAAVDTDTHLHIQSFVHWMNTDPITQINIRPDGYSTDNFLAGSYIRVIGVLTPSW